MANVVSGSNGGINLNTNISGPSGNYGRTIGVSESPASSSGFVMIPTEKKTETFNFGVISSYPKIDSEKATILDTSLDEQKYGDIVDINNKMESEANNSSKSSSGFVMIETENKEQKNIEFSSAFNISDIMSGAHSDIINSIDNLGEDYYIGIKNNNMLADTFNSTIEQLEREKEDLNNKYHNFMYSNSEYNPNLYYNNHNGYPLHPSELTAYNGIDWLEKNGYPKSDWDNGGTGRKAFYKYVEEVYTPLYNELFKEYVGMTYDEYISRCSKIDEDLVMLRAASYSLEQQSKQWTYVNIMGTTSYQAYADEFDRNSHISAFLIDTRTAYLTTDEFVMFCYLYEKKGETYAKNYLTAIEDTINQRRGKAEADAFIKSISGSDGKIDRNLWTGARTAGKGLLDGIDTFGEGISNLFATDGVISSNQYAQMYILEALGSQGIMDDTYLVSTSIGNMLPSIGVSALLSIVATPATGSVVGSALMGASAAGNAKNQALISGNGQLASIMYGLSVGLSETTLGLLMGNIPFLNTNARFGIKAILSEGVEEFTQTFVEAGLRSTILGESVDISKLMGEAGQSFIYGIITSGITTGGSLALNITMNGKKANIGSVNDIFSLLDILNSGDVSISKVNGSDVIILGSDVDVNGELVSTIKKIFPNAEIRQVVSSTGETQNILFKLNNIQSIEIAGNNVYVFESIDNVNVEIVEQIRSEYPNAIIGVKKSDGTTGILDLSNMTIRNDENIEIAILKEKMINASNNLIPIDPNELNYRRKVTISGETMYLFKTENESIEYGVNVYETYYVLTNSDGKYVGYVRGFSTRGKNAANNVTLEYEIDPSMQGKGYGTAMLSYITNDILSKGSLNGQDVPVVGIQGLQNTNIDTITLQISDNNIASQAIAEKNGFTKTGDMTYTITKEQYSSHVKEQQEKFRNNITNLGKGIYNTFSSVGKEIYNGIAPVGNMFYNMFTNVSNKIIGENSSAQNIPSLSTPKLVALLNECYNNRDIELLKKNVNVMTDTQINELLTYFKTNPSDMYLDVIESLTPEQFKFALDNNLLDIQNADGNIIISNDIFPLFLEYYYGSEYSIGMHGIDDRHLESGVNNATKIKESILNEGLCFKNYRSFLSTIMFGTDSMSNYLSAGVYDAGGVIVALPQVLKNSNGEEIYVGTPGDSVSDRNVGNGSLSEKAFADIYDENNNAINPMFILATYEKTDDGHVKITYNPNHISFNDGIIPNEYFEVIEGRINVNEGESSGDSFVNAGDLTADSDNNDVNNSQNTTIKYEAFDIDNIKSTYKLSDEVSFEIYDISVKYNVSNSEALIMYSLNLINSTRSVPIETVSEATAQIIAKNTQGYTDYGKQIWINNFNKLSNEQVQKFNEYITLITSLNYTLTINNPNDFGTIVLDSGEIVETDAYMKEETKKLLVELGFSSNSNIDIEEFVKNIFKVAPNLIDKKGTISSQELNEVIIDLVSNIFFIDNGVSNNLSDIEDIAIRLFGEDLEKIDIINNPENLKNFLQNLNNFEARVLYNYNESCILRNTNEILLAKDNWDNFDIDEKINFARNAYNARIYIRSNAQLMMIGSNSLPSTGTNPLMETFERAMIYRMTFNLIEFKKIINDIDCPKSILNVVNSLNITTNRMFADYFKNAVKNNKITIEDIEKLYYLLEENNEAQTLLSDAAYNLIKGTYRANETVNSTLGIYGEYIKKEN